jgi:hypothetical protein
MLIKKHTSLYHIVILLMVYLQIYKYLSSDMQVRKSNHVYNVVKLLEKKSGNMFCSSILSMSAGL